MCAQSGKLAFSFPASMGTARSGDSTRFSTTSSSYHIRPRSARLGVACSPFHFSSQQDFLNNLSLTSVSRLVDSARDCLKGTASDFSSDEVFQRVLVDPLESLRCFLGLLQSDRAVFWKRSLLSLKKNIHDRVYALQSVTMTGRFPSSEEQRRNALMNWQRRRTHLHGSVLQYGLRSSHQDDRQE